MPDDPEFIFPQVIDNTMRSDWKACPHRFFRRHIQGLASPGKSIHLHFGGCMARGLEIARRTFHSGKSPDAALFAGIEAAIAMWGDFDIPPDASRTAKLKTLDACILALAEYFKKWPLDDDEFTIHHHNNEPCIEFSGAWPIPGSRHPETGEPILYAGRFDAILNARSSVWGLDDKTTSSDPSSKGFSDQWRLRGQFTGYCWLAQCFGVRLTDFLIRGTQILTSEIRCGQIHVSRPDWMIDQWLWQLQADVTEMCRQYLAALIDPLHPYLGMGEAHPFPQAFDHACHDFASPCSFADLCSSQHPERWTDEFTIARWNPLVRAED
jgi:hypothetical protein